MQGFILTIKAVLWIVIPAIIAGIVSFLGTWAASLQSPDPTGNAAYGMLWAFFLLPLSMFVGAIVGVILWWRRLPPWCTGDNAINYLVMAVAGLYTTGFVTTFAVMVIANGVDYLKEDPQLFWETSLRWPMTLIFAILSLLFT